MNYGNVDCEKIGKFIRKLRIEKGMSQEDFGHALYISRKSVSKWEMGRACPSIDMLKRISEIFSISIADILDPPVNNSGPQKPKFPKLPRKPFIKIKYEKSFSIEI